jgi:hypothetical protein
MDGSPFQTITLTGQSSTITYQFQGLSNQVSGAVKTITLKLIVAGTGGTTATLSYADTWNWPERAGGAATSIAEGKVALLSLTSFGSQASDVVAAYAVTV